MTVSERVPMRAVEVSIDLRSRKLRLSVGGGFTAASAQIRRRAKTLAAGSLTLPTRTLTLRLNQPRRPRADTIAVAIRLGASTAVR